jgi:PAS domain S-box-containing protein
MTSNLAIQKQTGEAFLETREIIESLFDSVPGAVVVCDEKGSIVRVNAAMEYLFGYTRDELLLQPIEMLFPD